MKLLIVVLLLPITLVFGKYDKYLNGRNDEIRPRRVTFEKILSLMEDRKVSCIVETGALRQGMHCQGDGCGTWVLADWARDHGAQVYSVDISPESIDGAYRLFKSEQKKGLDCSHVHLICSDSIQYLTNFGKHIDFLYLDSYDVDFSAPWPSQRHHLAEIKAALPWISENTLIMIDDCVGKCRGKGGMVIEFLEERGWVVLIEHYQVILVHESTLSEAL